MSAQNPEWYQNPILWSNLGTLLINSSLTFFYWFKNNKLYGERKRQEVEFQSKTFVFQEVLIKKLDSFIKFTSDSKKMVIETSISVGQNFSNPTEVQNIIHVNIEKLDALYDCFQNTSVLTTQAFSKDVFNQINEITTAFYDAITDCISKFSNANGTSLSSIQQAQLNSADLKVEEFVVKFIEIIEKSQPKINI